MCVYVCVCVCICVCVIRGQPGPRLVTCPPVVSGTFYHGRPPHAIRGFVVGPKLTQLASRYRGMLPTYLPTQLATCLHAYMPTCLPAYLPIVSIVQQQLGRIRQPSSSSSHYPFMSLLGPVIKQQGSQPSKAHRIASHHTAPHRTAPHRMLRDIIPNPTFYFSPGISHRAVARKNPLPSKCLSFTRAPPPQALPPTLP